MVPLDITPILLSLIEGVLLAIFCGILASWGWLIVRLLERRPCLPPESLVERRPTPWGAGTILLVMLTYFVVSYEAFLQYHDATHPPAPVVKAPAQPDGKPAEAAPAKPEGAARGRRFLELSYAEMLAIQGTVNAVLLILLPGIARLTSGARPIDLGLTLRNGRRQIAVGIIAVLVLMPVVYIVQTASVWLLGLTPDQQKEFQHPIAKMLHAEFSPGIAILALLTAVVLAPAFEELLFRGFIQSWLVKSLGQILQPRPTPLEIVELPDPDLDLWEAIDEPSPQGTVPVETPPRSKTAAGAAIVLSSMIFAGLHADQWPAPIALFLLALGLGYVYERTGSLLAPICMHAVFNGFATLMLFLVALSPQSPEKEPAPNAVKPPTPVKQANQENHAKSPDAPSTPTLKK